ncbi:Protein kintoun (Dynein assembly factor 2, partial [Durusdinium trenchii]
MEARKPSAMPDEAFNECLRAAMASGKEELKMSAEEEERFLDAMKKPEFTKLMKDYMDEISDPRNRAEQEAYLRQMEAENRVPGHMRLIHPRAGFCIKALRCEQREGPDGEFRPAGKAFINVCEADEIEPPKENKTDKGAHWNLPYSLGPMRHENDKSNTPQPTFDFAMHPDTVSRCKTNARFQHMVIETALEAVEKRIDQVMKVAVKLDHATARVLRGVVCMGGKPAVMHIKASEPACEGEPPKDVAENNNKENKQGIKNSDDDKAKAVNATATEATPKPANEPKFTIVHRGQLDLADFFNTKNPLPVTSKRPKEIVLRVQVPKVKSARFLDIETSDAAFKLSTTDKAVADYELHLDLPYPVDSDAGKAKFDKATRVLEVTLPVRPPELELTPPMPPPRQEERAQESCLVQEVKQADVVVQEQEQQRESTHVEEQPVEKTETPNESDQQQEPVPTELPQVQDNMTLEEILEAAKQAAKLPLPKAEDNLDDANHANHERAAPAGKQHQQQEEEEEEQEQEEAPLSLADQEQLEPDQAEIGAEEEEAELLQDMDPKAYPFVASKCFHGNRLGYVFKSGPKGVVFVGAKHLVRFTSCVKELKGGHGADLAVCRDSVELVDVDLGKDNVVARLVDLLADFGKRRGYFLTGPAPHSGKVDNHGLALRALLLQLVPVLLRLNGDDFLCGHRPRLALVPSTVTLLRFLRAFALDEGLPELADAVLA